MKNKTHIAVAPNTAQNSNGSLFGGVKKNLGKLTMAGLIGLTCFSMSACDGDSSTGIPNSGNSGVGAPDSIIGGRLVINVTGGDQYAYIGHVENYFVSPTVVRGEGSITLDTKYWEYTKSGSQGRVHMVYSNDTTTTYLLTFDTPTSGSIRLNAGNLQQAGPYPVDEINSQGTFTLQ